MVKNNCADHSTEGIAGVPYRFIDVVLIDLGNMTSSTVGHLLFLNALENCWLL
jgi:hypothetical protein